MTQIHESTITSAVPPVELLILGAGWTSTFLIPLLQNKNISYAATRRSPAPESKDIAFSFDPESDDPQPYTSLPTAKTVLITFPIKVEGGSKKLVDLYAKTRVLHQEVLFVQLGSTGIYDGSPTLNATASVWKDRHSPYDTSNLRAIAEDELLALSAQAGHIRTTALDLCGLWGGARDPRHWVSRVAPNKEALAKKGSLHMIHGEDVARAIVAVHEQPEVANNQRWIITDGRVYDWWDLASAWAHDQEGGNDKEPYAKWVRELLREHEVRALPRTPELIGRALDGREFWEAFGLDPVRARLEKV